MSEPGTLCDWSELTLGYTAMIGTEGTIGGGTESPG